MRKANLEHTWQYRESLFKTGLPHLQHFLLRMRMDLDGIALIYAYKKKKTMSFPRKVLMVVMPRHSQLLAGFSVL
jgi:hypothetical protein